MKSKIIQDADVITYVVVCDPDDEAVCVLTDFARAEDLEASQITGVGGFERATLGSFDRETKQHRPIEVDEGPRSCRVESTPGSGPSRS